MRGGTANCTVIISDEEIGSPLVRNPKAVLIMNQPSLDKYEALVQKNGFLVVNTSLVNRPVKRTDIQLAALPATEMAEQLGDKRLANMVLLGNLMKHTSFVPMKSIEEALNQNSSEKQKNLLDLNLKALHKGADFS